MITFTIPLRLHYNGNNSLLFANVAKIHLFKAKDPEVKPYLLCLGKSSKAFTANNMKKVGLKDISTIFSLILI